MATQMSFHDYACNAITDDHVMATLVLCLLAMDGRIKAIAPPVPGDYTDKIGGPFITWLEAMRHLLEKDELMQVAIRTVAAGNRTYVKTISV